MEKIQIFDTTLRDGEQTPKVNLNKEDKVLIARQLEKLGVDIIEAGFPVSSQGDFEAVNAVAKECKTATVCALARCKKIDIDAAYKALIPANKKRIHVFLATSDIHLNEKLKISKEEALKIIDEMVRYAKSKVSEIQFSAEDASRSDKDFLCRAFETAINAGATILNVPDTVGYSQPSEFKDFISYIKNNTKGIEKAIISVHCHNDLGTATANALMGVLGGARQIECTINGLGERAGNASVDEVIMTLKTRKDIYNFETNIKTKELYKTAKIVSALANIAISPTKAIVGENCFLHESGIHQDGILKNRKTYEILDPIEIGIPLNDGLVLGKHSGRHAFKAYLEHSGLKLEDEKINTCFDKFKKLTAEKKYVNSQDIIDIISGEINFEPLYKFVSYSSTSNEYSLIEIVIKLKKGNDIIEKRAIGNGQVNAAYNAINKIINANVEITDYKIQAISGASDALGEAKITMKYQGIEIKSSGLDKDIIKASILAYINGINKLGINF